MSASSDASSSIAAARIRVGATDTSSPATVSAAPGAVRPVPTNWSITPRPPSTCTLPSSARRSPRMIRSSVDLPAPFAPMSAVVRPSVTRKARSASSGRPSGSEKETPLTSMKPMGCSVRSAAMPRRPSGSRSDYRHAASVATPPGWGKLEACNASPPNRWTSSAPERARNGGASRPTCCRCRSPRWTTRWRSRSPTRCTPPSTAPTPATRRAAARWPRRSRASRPPGWAGTSTPPA